MEDEQASIKEAERFLGILIKQYEEGDPYALLKALRLVCVSRYISDIPDQISRPIVDAIDRWLDLEVKTLDEAFSVERPKGFRHENQKRKRRLQGKIFQEVVNRHKAGASIGPTLFADVGKDFDISGSLVNKWYDEERNTLLDVVKGDPDLLKKVQDYLRLQDP